MDLIGWISVGISLLMTGFNVAMFVVVKFNDLFHLTQKVDEIKEMIKNLDEREDKNAERIATIEGKCSANHP